MTYTLAISGMSCDHCVRRVRKALAAVPGVSVSDVEVGRARVEAADADAATRAIEALGAAGYAAQVSS